MLCIMMKPSIMVIWRPAAREHPKTHGKRWKNFWIPLEARNITEMAGIRIFCKCQKRTGRSMRICTTRAVPWTEVIMNQGFHWISMGIQKRSGTRKRSWKGRKGCQTGRNGARRKRIF